MCIDLHTATLRKLRYGAQQGCRDIALDPPSHDGGLFVVALVALAGKVPALSAIGYALMAAFFPSGWNFLGRYFSPSGGYLFPMARWINRKHPANPG